MTRAESRIMAVLADAEWHPESEIRSSRVTLERLWLNGKIEGAMLGVGAYPEQRLWRLGRDPMFPPATEGVGMTTTPEPEPAG